MTDQTETEQPDADELEEIIETRVEEARDVESDRLSLMANAVENNHIRLPHCDTFDPKAVRRDEDDDLIICDNCKSVIVRFPEGEKPQLV